MTSRIPRPLARRLNRLAQWAHLFHRYAHHPLCDEYRGELIPLGHRARVCRGCALVLLGSVAGVPAGWLLALPAPAVGLMALAVWGLSLLPLGRSKLRTRFAPALALGLALGSGLASRAWLIALGAVALFAVTWSASRRRKPDRTPCLTCPERMQPTPCRGVRPIVRRERAFQRLAAKLLNQAGL